MTEYVVTFIPREPKCIVCNQKINIIHQVQRTKKYCSYECQQKAARERKKNNEAKLLQSI